MVDDLRALIDRARAWIERGRAAGWLTADDAERLAGVESRRPGDLVQNAAFRPLVVALFGGTGVGKSSLLNRIAGESIARVGVERPTSREVTIYLHASIELADLPPELPLDRVQVSRHHNDACREIVWIDAPDIDSTEEANRRCALAWLPHTHLVCYVVSPERYKDDAGWRVLRERGDRHGWMFILNRWDEGHAAQRDDFARLLGEAGFETPLVATTSCSKRATPTPDELDVIHRRIARLLDEHGVVLLNQQVERTRLQDLRGVMRVAMARLGDDGSWNQMREAARSDWRSAAQIIQQAAMPAIQVAAQRIAARSPSMATRISRATILLRGQDTPLAATSSDDAALFAADLWDEAAANRLASCLDAVEVRARLSGLAAAPIRERLDSLARRAHAEMGRWIGSLAASTPHLAASGPRRAMQSALQCTAKLLPGAGVCVVAYAVIVGYWQASTGRASFLGGDFAIHSAMFVFLLWLFPTLLERWLRPSVEAAAHGAVTSALSVALNRLGERLDETLKDARLSAESLAQEGSEILTMLDDRIDALQADSAEPVRGLVAGRTLIHVESRRKIQVTAQ